MSAPFKLNATLGRTYNADLGDSLRTKQALDKLGHFDMPPYGMTAYPDEPLFQGIEKFQEQHGLQRDGIMKPDGETATKLGQVLAETNQPRYDRSTPKPKGLPLDAVNGATEKRRPSPASAKPSFLPITLKHTVDPSANVEVEDVANVKGALSKFGLLQRSGHEFDAYPDHDMFNGIRGYQRKKGLRIDGVMKPGGETVTAINEDLSKETEGTGPTSNTETAFVPVAVPFAIWLMPILGAATAMAAMAIYNQLSKSRQGELRESYDKDRENDNSCYHRWQNENDRCGLRAPKWQSGCRERARDRHNLCVANGGTPEPDEPPEWGKDDEQVSPSR